MKRTMWVLLILLQSQIVSAAWDIIPTGTTNTLRAVEFVDLNTGWAVGDNGTIIKTTNSGLSWVAQNSGTTTFLYSVDFINANIGWAAGDNGLILKTTNGGVNWLVQNTGITTNIQNVKFFNSSIGLIIATYGYIYKTTDGGNTWAYTSSNGQTGANPKIQFIDSSIVFAGAMKSTNSGNSWANSGGYSTVDFVNSNTGWSITGYNGKKTTDAGNTWSLFTVSPMSAASDIHFVNTNVGWSIGSAGKICRSTDGGTNWTLQNSNTTLALMDLHFVGENNGFLVGQNGLFLKYTVPSQPQPISPENGSIGNSISPLLQWNIANNATGYQLQMSTSSTFNQITWQEDLQGTIKQMNNLPFNTSYYWRVRAFNGADTSVWSNIWSFTTRLQQPNVPILISPLNNSNDVGLIVNIIWDYSYYASLYRVQVSISQSFSNLLFNDTVSSTTKLLSGLSYNTQYFWRVKGMNISDTSDWSAVWSFTTQQIVQLPASWAVTGQTGNNATIGFLPAGYYKIGNRTLTNGDAIGVFYNDNSVQKCGGYFVWDGQQFGIVAWGDDDYTTAIKEGFASNETYVYKIWDSQAQVVYDAAVKYVSGPTAYQHNAMSTVDTVLAITSITQTIPLNQSWNMISAYVTPDIPSYSTIMSPIVSSLQLAKNLAGQVYSPPFQTSLSTWNIYHAYMVRMNQTASLQITGIKIAPEKTPISITSTGTNWIPYLRTSSMAVLTALSTISGKYLQVKSVTGQVYQPPFFLSLSQLAPNNGYNINMSQTGTLTYPANAVTKSASTGEVVIREPQVFVRDKQITGKTAVIAMDLQNIEDGDEIGVFTSDGMLVGSSVWQYGMHGVVVWGDDESTNFKDGAAEGEALTVKVWNKATKNIGAINQISLNDMTNNAESFELTYETDAVHLLKGAAELSSNETKLFVSPQPASTEVMVKLNVTTENEVGVKLYSQEGKLSFETSTNANGNVLKVNTSNLSSGIYQMILTIDGKTYGERVVIVR